MGDAVDPRHDRREAGADRATAGGRNPALARLRDRAIAIFVGKSGTPAGGNGGTDKAGTDARRLSVLIASRAQRVSNRSRARANAYVTRHEKLARELGR